MSEREEWADVRAHDMALRLLDLIDEGGVVPPRELMEPVDEAWRARSLEKLDFACRGVRGWVRGIKSRAGN